MKHHTDAASNCLSYDILSNLKARILQGSSSEQISPANAAHLVHDALLGMFLNHMPSLQQKQIREVLIFGSTPIQLKGSVPPVIAPPEWTSDELHRDPTAVYQQIRFSHDETRGPAIHTSIPNDMVPLLVEYRFGR